MRSSKSPTSNRPGYGFNQDRWRSWWMNEKTNRDLQKPNTNDGIIAANKAAK